MKPLFPVIATLCLYACTPVPDLVPAPSPLPGNGLEEREPDSCGAAELAYLIGQPEGMLRTVRLKGRYRTIGPGDIVTQEYDAYRVDAYLDENGMIQRLTCG